MTGYLQRLASSVLRPGGSVRPIAGTVFSAPRPRAGPEPVATEQDIMAAKSADVDPRRSGLRPPAREPAPRPLVPGDPLESPREARMPPPLPSAALPGKPPATGEPDAAPPAPRREPPAAPRMPVPAEPFAVRRVEERREAGPEARRTRLDPDLGAPRHEAPARHEAAAREVPPLPAAAPIGKGRADEVPLARVEKAPVDAAAGRVFVPMVAAESRPPAPPGGNAAAPAEPPRLAGQRERNGAAKVPAAPREPDEINIHIGRIEVTAAQPPPLRPAPKAQRKAPSLDDYLRRHGGRGR